MYIFSKGQKVHFYIYVALTLHVEVVSDVERDTGIYAYILVILFSKTTNYYASVVLGVCICVSVSKVWIHLFEFNNLHKHFFLKRTGINTC
jgi:hypothetical protein